MFSWVRKFFHRVPESGLKKVRDPYALIKSYNGYEREWAVRHFGEVLTADAIPLLIERLNDWVPQVRAVAREVLEGYVTPEMSSAWIRHVEELAALKKKTRADHSCFFERVNGLFHDVSQGALLESAMNSAHALTTRFAYEAAFRNRYFEREVLGINILRTRDIGLRHLLLAHLRTFDDSFYQRIELTGMADMFALTRIAFLRESLYRKTFRSKDFVSASLMDRSFGVRQLAIFHASDFSIDPVRVYLDLFESADSTSQKCLAIWGLGYLMHEASEPQIKALLSNSTRSIYYAAIRALLRINPKGVRDILITNLKEEDAYIRRFSTRALIKLKVVIPKEKLLSLMNEADDTLYVKAVVLPLGQRLSKWDALALIFHIALWDKNMDLKNDLRSFLRKWNSNFNRSHLRLSDSQRVDLMNLLDMLPKGIFNHKSLRFTLESG